MSEWETFCDISYYHLWRVRRKTERGFNDGFHLQHGEEAKALVELLNRLERERAEALEDLEFRRGLYKVQEERLENAREQVKELIYIADRAIALADIDFENDKFGVVSELRDDLEKIKKSK